MGNKLILIGGGGHCQSVLDTAIRMREFDEIVITDSQLPVGTRILGCEVVGNDDYIEYLMRNGFEYAFITVGSVGINPLREKLACKLDDWGLYAPSIIDPSAIVSSTAFIGAGSFVGKNVIINSSAYVGCHCIINTGAIIEHGCKVGNYSHISVGAILCGAVIVGENCFIGAGSTVIQNVNIGDKVTIGANSTVLHNVENNMKYYGNVTVGGGKSHLVFLGEAAYSIHIRCAA